MAILVIGFASPYAHICYICPITAIMETEELADLVRFSVKEDSL